MKTTTARLLQTLPALALTCSFAWVASARAQDGADQPERRWQTVRRGELVAGSGDKPWQNATHTAVSYTLTPDPQDPNADLLIVRPLATTVGATGRGDAAVGFGPEAASVFRIDRATGTVTRVDGQDAAALDAVNASAAQQHDPVSAEPTNARPDNDTAEHGDNLGDNDTRSAAARSVSVPLASLDAGLTGLGNADLDIVSTPVIVNGQTVAHLQQYSAAPLSFTTAQGDTVLLSAGGYVALDPSGAVVLASGQSTAGQVVTADGSLQPFATQQSSRASAAGGGPDPLSPAARAALNALLPNPAPLTDAGFAQATASNNAAGAPDGSNPVAAPAWAGAVTTVAAGIDALAGAAGNAFGDAPDPFAAARAASGLAAAAVGEQINALALTSAAATGSDPDTAAAYRGLAQRVGGGAGTGLLAQTPGGSVQPAGPAGPSALASALADALAPGGAASPQASAAVNPLAENPLAPSGVAPGQDTVPAGPSVTTSADAAAGLTALDALNTAPRAPRGSASGADALRSALGGAPAGGVGGVATALGGGAIYGIDPVSGAAGALPNLATQVVVTDTDGQRTAVANGAATTFVPATFPNFNPGVLPGSSGGFSSITVPNGLFTFSVFDSGRAENEDVQNITLTNNGNPVAVMSAAGGNGTGTTLFFLTNGEDTTFNASTNPAVDANRFSATVSPGTAILSLEGVSSTFGPNTGAFVITSPVTAGTNQQVFELRQTPSVPPSDDLDFARLGILVQN